MSVLAKEIQKEFQLSQEYIQAGFQHMLKVGELLAEVEKLAGAEEVSTWLSENCSDIDTGAAKESLKLFKGEKVEVQAYRTKEKEVQES